MRGDRAVPTCRPLKEGAGLGPRDTMQTCVHDIDGDRITDIMDLLVVIAGWGDCH